MKWSIPPSFSRSMGAPPPPALLTSPRIAGKSTVFAFPVGNILGCLLVVFFHFRLSSAFPSKIGFDRYSREQASQSCCEMGYRPTLHLGVTGPLSTAQGIPCGFSLSSLRSRCFVRLLRAFSSCLAFRHCGFFVLNHKTLFG